MKTMGVLLLLAICGTATAATGEIPLNEQAFVDRMKTADRKEIVAMLGEPARAIDVTDENTGEVFGSIWHYHYLNTADDGNYYPVTELDFVGDRVVTVVFSSIEDDSLAAAAPDAR